MRIFLVIMVCGIVAFTLLYLMMRNNYMNNGIELEVNRIRAFSENLSTKISDNLYLKNSASLPEIDKELLLTAQHCDGRIVVVDNALKIIYDSYGIETGKTLISKEVVKAISGMENVYLDKEDRKAELTYPIYVTNPESGYRSYDGAIIFDTTLENEYTLADNVGKRFVLLGTVSFILLFVIAYFYSKHLTEPLRKVSEAIKHAGNGYMERPETVSGYNEIEDVSNAFGGLYDRLQQLEDTRQEFVSNVSHELKTPMTSMKVLADSLLANENVPAEMYREFLSDINSEIDRENKIITDLLTLTKLNRSEGSMHIAQVDINELLENTMHRIGPIARVADVELSLTSYRPVVAEVDEVKLSLAFTNLIENGVKYNKKGGYVRVTLNSDHIAFYVKVEDSGIGIPEEDISKIFDRFYRVDKTRSRESGGTGLGLAIVKNVVIMHKGEIRAESTLGEGTTFTMRIPLTFI